MGTLVGVWIDHTKAVIVEAGKDAVALVASHVPAHTRFTGGGGSRAVRALSAVEANAAARSGTETPSIGISMR
jgi:hypothetical protein